MNENLKKKHGDWKFKIDLNLKRLFNLARSDGIN